MSSVTIDRPSGLDIDAFKLEKELCLEQRRLIKAQLNCRKRLDDLGGCPDKAEIIDLDSEVAELQWKLYDIVSRATRGVFSPNDISDWVEHVRVLGGQPPTFGSTLLSDLVHVRRVPNAAFRANWLQNKQSLTVLGRLMLDPLREFEDETGKSMGGKTLLRQTGDIDTSTLKRMLGAEAYTANYKRHVRIFIQYELAVVFARAMKIVPHEAGI
jgi:hypothetical protein